MIWNLQTLEDNQFMQRQSPLCLQMDNRMRAWYKQNMSVGLLYTCSMGGVRPDRPVALIQNRKRDGSDFMEVIPMEHQLPAQREQVPLSHLNSCKKIAVL